MRAGNIEEIVSQAKVLCEKENLNFLDFKMTNHLFYHGRVYYQCKKCNLNHNIAYRHLKCNHGCPKCSGKLKLNISDIKYQFNLNNYILLSEEYINAHKKLDYICKKHPNSIQQINWNNFKSGKRCYVCSREARTGSNSSSWKGGTTPLYNHLRTNLLDWIKLSIKNSNYKCVVSGEPYQENFEVHHLLGFNIIIKHILTQLNLTAKEVKEYTPKEMESIKNLNKLEHQKLLGACLKPEVHDLFHSLYGFGDNTPEQFYEFKERFRKGEIKLDPK